MTPAQDGIVKPSAELFCSPRRPAGYEGWVDHFSAHEKTVEWVVKGTGTVEVEVDFQRGGKVRALVTVDGDAESKL